jgi:sulfonate transport system substrate-binding protein
VADLKGKKIGFAKAAGVHYLLIAALDKAGLSFKDIEPAYLTPADGRAAFEKGAIDAWVVWDPFLSAAQRQSKVRVLADGTGIASYQRYYLAGSKFAKARPDVLRVIYAELEKTGKWVKQNPKEAAALLSPVWGLDAATIEQANARRSYAVRPVAPEGLTEQQRIADAFFTEKLLPRKINALDVALFKPGA